METRYSDHRFSVQPFIWITELGIEWFLYKCCIVIVVKWSAFFFYSFLPAASVIYCSSTKLLQSNRAKLGLQIFTQLSLHESKDIVCVWLRVCVSRRETSWINEDAAMKKDFTYYKSIDHYVVGVDIVVVNSNKLTFNSSDTSVESGCV